MKFKAARGRAEILKRHGTCRNPKYIKAARGRAEIRNISKRRETRRTPKARERAEIQSGA